MTTECSLFFVLIIQRYLPIPTLKILSGEYLASPKEVSISSITGRGQLDCFVIFFLKSVQNLLDPFFLSTTTMGKLQGDLEGCIMLAANISSIALSTIFLLAKGVLYGFSFMGG